MPFEQTHVKKKCDPTKRKNVLLIEQERKCDTKKRRKVQLLTGGAYYTAHSGGFGNGGET